MTNSQHHGPHCAGSCEGAAYSSEIQRLRGQIQEMVAKAAAQSLGGYRELGRRAADAENECDRLRADNEALREALKDALDDWDDSHFDEEYPHRIEWADKARAALDRGEK